MCAFERFMILYIICIVYSMFNLLIISNIVKGFKYDDLFLLIIGFTFLTIIDILIPCLFIIALFKDDCLDAIESRKERIKEKRKQRYLRMISKQNDEILHNFVQEKYLINIIKEYAGIIHSV